ncbi:MAG: fibronectin type III domain-containing protein [Kouleothrix sp.]|nr:fibronectin type III domain-containing protein [Kouleothrix sp.]
MRPHVLYRALIVFALAAAGMAGLAPRAASAAPQPIYGDALAAGWDNWSWISPPANLNLAATAPVHGGTHSIAATYGAWQGIYLHHAGISTAGFTKLSFFVHGGAAGGQRLNLFATRASDPNGAHGPEVALPQPAANAWTAVQIPLADLGAAGTVVTGLTWQDATGGAQPALYLDDIALASDESPDGPVLSGGLLAPRAAPADGFTAAVVKVVVADPQGPADIAGVTLDAAAIGRGAVALRDDGRSNDGAAGDGVYGAALSIAPGTPAGERQLLVTARDQAGHSASLQLGAFEVLSPPGGAIPAALPQRIGWGTNEWSETPGADWQVNSGVPWDYVYQYITYEWYSDPGHWGGNFVGRFAQQAWGKGYIPVISAYLILGAPPVCGEGGACYAQKLKSASAVSGYLAALQMAASEAKGVKPVIFQIDPDFYGYMQQLSNQPGRPAGVRPDDPSSYVVALNVPGYPNTLAGLGRRIVDLIHTTAPNALVAPHASMWATNLDPSLVPAAEAAVLAQRTAAFIDAMGGAQSDLLFVEWSDRDSGCTDLPQCQPPRPWWDDTNRTLPHPARAALWENALSAAAGKRLILWQVPSGNMALDNTCDRYKDNRSAYAFGHPRDLADTGVLAVLFGGGAECMTAPSTDGGLIAGQGAIAYALPAAPTGLTADPPAGPLVALRWDESALPDLWGYRVSYQPSGGGATTTLDTSRASAARLLLPQAGSWSIRVAAYDAMGRLGPSSAPLTVVTGVDAQVVLVPLARR